MTTKRTVPQSVFDSPEARRIARQAHHEAVSELNRTPRHLLSSGNPNYPDNDPDGPPVTLFGYETKAFLAKQYR